MESPKGLAMEGSSIIKKKIEDSLLTYKTHSIGENIVSASKPSLMKGAQVVRCFETKLWTMLNPFFKEEEAYLRSRKGPVV